MKNQFSLEINQSCSEDFNEFKPTLKGGFCASCKKEVIDFSKMNSQEVRDYFKNKSKNNVCGKFKTNQLKTYTNNSKSRKKISFWTGIGLACLSIFSFNTIQAQTNTPNNSSNKNTKNQNKLLTIKGVVSDDIGPLADVSVQLKGTTIGTVTNFDGVFEFPKKLNKGDVLVFSYVGMKSKEVVIDNSSSLKIELKVNMKPDSCIIMGKVAIKKVYKSKK